MSVRPLIALLTISLLVLAGVVVAPSLTRIGGTFPGFIVWQNGTLAAFHTEDWTGPRAGVPLNGGRIVAVDGAPFESGAALLRQVSARPEGDVVRYTILHRGERADFAVPTMRLTWQDWLATFGNYLVNSLAFFAIGLVALALRPDLAVARALAGSMLLFGLLMLLTIDFFTTYRFVPLCQMIEASTPPAFALLGLLFPVPRLGRTLRRSLVGLLFAVFLGLGLVNVALFASDPDRARWVTSAVYLAIAVTAIGMLVSFAHALRRARDVRTRVQAAVVFAGALVAFLLPSLLVVAFFPLGWSFSFTWITLPLLFFPLSILYAVVRYDLLGAERFIRITVGYTVATGAVMVTYAAVALALDRVVGPGTSRSPASSFAVLLAIAVLFDPIRRRVQAGVDRVFFRSVVDPARVLEESGAELLTLPDEASIVRHAEERLRAALDLEWARLEPGEETAAEADLLAPVRFRGEQLGTLVGGPKRSGAPWSAAERELAQGLASQLALALHNARSVEALARAREQLYRAERLALIGELAGAVAHGVRNPLSGIRAAAQMALEDVEGGPGREALEGVIREADRLEQRIRSLLDFSRPFEPDLREIELGPVLRAVAETLRSRAAAQSVELTVELPDAPLRAEADPDYVEEVVLELAGNALRAMPDGGRLTLRGEALVRGAALEVSDSGPGVPEGVAPRIFDLFFTTRKDGSGIGLATVRKVVERLGGRVALERTGPGGTTFRIELA